MTIKKNNVKEKSPQSTTYISKNLENRLTILAILIYTLYCFRMYNFSPSPDFLANWMAGKAWIANDLDSIYPTHSDVFDLLAPMSWYQDLISQGHSGEVYPFVYPPLWAAVFGYLGTIVSYSTLQTCTSLLNPILLACCPLLAHRISGRRDGQITVVLCGLVIFSTTVFGIVALTQNQPQILVAFLTLLAIERAQSGHPLAAGAALALAAAIKVYPVFFVILFIAAGHKRAAAYFTIVGLILGLTSILVAGWPLHLRFLDLLSVISGTVVESNAIWTIDALVGQLFFLDQMPPIPRPDWAELNGSSNTQHLMFRNMAKPLYWQIASFVLIGLSVVFSATMFWRAKRDGAETYFLWPIAIGMIALASPLSWIYHYIAIVAFAPLLLSIYGNFRGGLLLFAIFAPTTEIGARSILKFSWPPIPLQVVGLFLIFLLLIIYSRAALLTKPRLES